MIDPDIRHIQRAADWTDEDLIDNIYDYINIKGDIEDLLTFLSDRRKKVVYAKAEDTAEFKACKQFLLEEFPKAEDQGAAITEFLSSQGHARGLNYIVMIAERHRDDPVLAPILQQLKVSLLG